MNKKNENLNKAKVKKDDEFYTLLDDIENELKYYKNQLKNKIIFMPCDDPELITNLPKGNYPEDRASKFWVYFHKNFKHLKLKKIIATHFKKDEKNSYMIEYDGMGKDDNIFEFKKTNLKSNGDFRSDEIQIIYNKVDVIITNPPFSLFIEFLINLVIKNKKFLIIANEMKASSKTIFPFFKNNNVWFGYNNVKKFLYYDKFENITKIQNFGNISWLTNLDVKKRHEELIMVKKYNAKDYPKFDNIDAISVPRIDQIPCDYFDLMGVPISFLKKYNAKQFEIIDIDENYVQNIYKGKRAYLNGQKLFARIIIRRNNSDN